VSRCSGAVGLGNLRCVSVDLDVELLWWEGCPSTGRAHDLVRAELDALGLGPVEIRMVEITTDAQARERAFRGSPTILLDGEDLIHWAGGAGSGGGDAGVVEPAALTCRVYHRRDGRISPIPDAADVRAAIQRAGAAHRVRERAA